MKYAFFDQYERLTPGTTNAWAFEQIKKNSYVLEVGCSVGYLTKHLKEEKECCVDIIEIDEQAGKIASQYAHKAYIGKDGDLDENCLLTLDPSVHYDYIVVLDVLEHLRCPERVLGQIHGLLREDGTLILSVPNIAHNSVLINLFNNRFEYTKLGLLDRTHITFFTYKSLVQELQKAEFAIDSFQTCCKHITETEISNTYEDLPRSLRSEFRSRPYADAYQFLIQAHRKGNSNDEGLMCPEYEEQTELECSLYYAASPEEGFDEKRRVAQSVKLGMNTLLYAISNGKRCFRVGPSGHNCILRNLGLSAGNSDGMMQKIEEYRINGVFLPNGCIAFTGEQKPCIEFSLEDAPDQIYMTFDMIACDEDVLDIVDEPIRGFSQQHEELLKVYDEKGELAQINQQQHEELLKVYGEKGELAQINQQQHEELLKVYDEKGELAQINQQQHEELLKVYDEKGELAQINQQQHEELLRVYGEKGTLAQVNTQQHEELLKVYGEKGVLTQVNQQQKEQLEKTEEERARLEKEKDSLIEENERLACTLVRIERNKTYWRARSSGKIRWK